MSIYSTTHQVATPLNGIGGMNDGTGTINPAALNSSGVPPSLLSFGLSRDLQLGPLLCLKAPSQNLINATSSSSSMAEADLFCFIAVLPQASTVPSPRGIKRSRSPDQQDEGWVGADDDGTCDFSKTPSPFL
jgi:hypothetical protein